MLKRTRLKSLILLSALMTTVTLTPRKSEAIIGAATGNLPAIVVGGAFLGLGVGSYISMKAGVQWNMPGDGMYQGMTSFLMQVVGALVLTPVGIVLLEEQGSGVPVFQKIDAKKAEKLGLSAKEWASYESELPEINSMLQSDAAVVMNQKPETFSQAIKISENFWKENRTVLSPETVSALVKIGSFAIQ